MNFTVVDEIPFSREQVFRTHRDRMADMVEYMPDIDTIEVVAREEDGDLVRLVNHWAAAQTEVPRIARAFIKPEMLRWVDTASWDQSRWRCEWNIELGFLPEAISCRGHNEFEELKGKTRITMNGELSVNTDKVPGVPKLLGRKMTPQIEKFVINLIEPNMRETNKVVARYLTDNS